MFCVCRCIPLAVSRIGNGNNRRLAILRLSQLPFLSNSNMNELLTHFVYGIDEMKMSASALALSKALFKRTPPEGLVSESFGETTPSPPPMSKIQQCVPSRLEAPKSGDFSLAPHSPKTTISRFHEKTLAIWLLGPKTSFLLWLAAVRSRG